MNKVLLTLLALSLIVASCKKETPKEKEEESNVPCQMIKGSSENQGGSIVYCTYIYDEKGRITKLKYSDNREVSYSYSSNQIIEERWSFNSPTSKHIYQLDASGKIVSSNKIINGTETPHKYIYNADGYISEESTDDGSSSAVFKYSYINGNLTSVRSNYLNDPGKVSVTTISYTNELTPSRFFAEYYTAHIPTTYILKAYFGKASKNLISEVRNSSSYSFTYQKDSEGNVIKMTER